MFSFCDLGNQTTYYEQAKKVVEKAKNNGRPIGCFISELAVSAAGVVIPPLGLVLKMCTFNI